MSASPSCRVFLVDDHPLLLSGVRALVESQAEMEVVGVAGDAECAMTGIEATHPDLVVVDGTLSGANGISLVAQIGATWPSIRTLALTLHEEGAYVREFLKAGAKGFVLKRSAAEDLLQAIRSVMQGGTYIDPAVASKVIALPSLKTHPSDALSEREEHVVRLVAEGFSNKEISRRLAISVKDRRNLPRPRLRKARRENAGRPGPARARTGLARKRMTLSRDASRAGGASRTRGISRLRRAGGLFEISKRSSGEETA